MKEMSLFEEPMQGRPFLKWAGGKGQLIVNKGDNE